ncbi:MAG: hypothetical protein J3K34DRAFT_516428 [Monoraphidium minutum]|nr:MAG: hypothetical protein J3K34DRAFT_516428 [Monoraphidium minutum]
MTYVTCIPARLAVAATLWLAMAAEAFPERATGGAARALSVSGDGKAPPQHLGTLLTRPSTVVPALPAPAPLAAGAPPPVAPPGGGRRLLEYRIAFGPAAFPDPAAYNRHSKDEADPFGISAAARAWPPAISPRGPPMPPPQAPAAPQGAGGRHGGPGGGGEGLPRCYFSQEYGRCFLNPFFPLTYEPPEEDPVARFELKLLVRGYACWQQPDAASCAARRGAGCRWLEGGGGGGGASPWARLGRRCVLDEEAHAKATAGFYLCPGSMVQRYVACGAARSPAACAAAAAAVAGSCAWSEATAYDDSNLRYTLGGLNDTLSWLTIRPLATLPLDARCRPARAAFDDGDAASGPPLRAAAWGGCNTVARLNGADGCDGRGDAASCPPLDGPYDDWQYGQMLRRTRKLLGGGAWGARFVSDWWYCDGQGRDAAACGLANVTAPIHGAAAAAAGGGGGGGGAPFRLLGRDVWPGGGGGEGAAGGAWGGLLQQGGLLAEIGGLLAAAAGGAKAPAPPPVAAPGVWAPLEEPLLAEGEAWGAARVEAPGWGAPGPQSSGAPARGRLLPSLLAAALTAASAAAGGG